MPYYVRCFCTAGEVPAINTVLRSLRQSGFEFSAQANNVSELDTPEWRNFELLYKAGKEPMIVECNRDDGEGSLAREECAEFIAELEAIDHSPARNRVIEHLQKTRFIVCCQLLSDIDDDGYEANGEFLTYFIDHCGGLVQADGEGFYDGMDLTDLLLRLE